MVSVSLIGSPMEAFALSALVLVVGVISIGVYLDSQRIGMGRPLVWTGLVVTGWLLTLGLYLLTDAPAAGLLVLGIGATALYLFERDDHLHGEEPADPRTLQPTTDDESERHETDSNAGSEDSLEES